MPDTDITPIQGFAAGMNQRVLDEQKLVRAPLETQLLQAHAGKATLDLQNQQKMMQMMSEYGTGQARQGDSMADRADFIGDLYLKSGMPEAGLKAMNYASLARARASTAQAAGTRAVLNQGKALVQDLELYERYMNGATDQADFDARNARYFANTGKIGMLAGHEWSPQTMEELTKQTLGAKDRLNLGMRGQENASRDSLRQRRIDEMDTLDAYREWKKGFMKRQQDWRGKHVGAGKGVASPSKDEQTETLRLIKRDYPDLYSKAEEAQNAAFTVASRARELRQQNPAISSKEAIARAYTEAVKGGEFKHAEAKKFLGFTTQKAEDKFLGEGKSADTAMALPKTAANAGKGEFYILRDGRVGQWTGTGFSIAAEDPGDGDEVDDPDDEDD